jgi:hypothetical protein
VRFLIFGVFPMLPATRELNQEIPGLLGQLFAIRKRPLTMLRDAGYRKSDLIRHRERRPIHSVAITQQAVGLVIFNYLFGFRVKAKSPAQPV